MAGTEQQSRQRSDITYVVNRAGSMCTTAAPLQRGPDRLSRWWHSSSAASLWWPVLADVLGRGRLGGCCVDCDGSPAAHGLRGELIGSIMGALDDILAGVREDLAIRQSSVSLERLKERCQHVDAAIDPMPRFRGPGVAVIAEVKRSSPSKGTLAQIADPAALAVEYEAGGAAAISVLTEERHFAGSLDDLVRVRCAVDIPVLRKDFIVTAYQLFEARSAEPI